MTDGRWEIALAAIRSGIILSPVPALCTEADIRYRCNQTKAAVFVGDAKSVGKFMSVRSECPSVRKIIQLEGLLWDTAISLSASLAAFSEDAQVRSVRRPWNTPALTYFTSGTSGPPKMVRHNQVSMPFGESSLLFRGKSCADLCSDERRWQILVSINSGQNAMEHGRARSESSFGSSTCWLIFQQDGLRQHIRSLAHGAAVLRSSCTMIEEPSIRRV